MLGRRLGCLTFVKVVDAVLTLVWSTRFLSMEKDFDLRSRTAYQMALAGHSLLAEGYVRDLALCPRHPEWHQGDL
jgi:hypothetical protein